MSLPATSPQPIGPVSSALEADLRGWIQKHGVVVWLDLDGHYDDFVDALAARRADKDLPYDVFAYRGSHLALMLALEGVAGGAHRPPMVIHLPGFTEDRVRETPLLELYLAGARYRKALPTLVEEAAGNRVPVEQVRAFVSEGALTLAGADAWLEAQLTSGRDGIEKQLQAMAPTALLDDLLAGGFFSKAVADPANAEAVWRQLATWTAAPEAWRELVLSRSKVRAEDLAVAASSWALAVEYVRDLGRAPVSARLEGIDALPSAVVEACEGIARHLRDRHPDFYRRTAGETEDLLEEEKDAALAEDLGKVDTFRFEEATVLGAALEALGAERYADADAWATPRLEDKQRSFWVSQDLERRATWQLVQAAAGLGAAIQRAGPALPKCAGLEDAVRAYVERGAAVDRAHRHLEQRRVALLYPRLAEFERVRARLDEMRGRWRAWADGWARGFNALCRAEGFLPSPAMQQRYVFSEVVKPLVGDHAQTAYFLVDAFRYEMADELRAAIDRQGGARAQLDARLAELPTVTEVGMNVLALSPDGDGRLRPSLTDADGGRIEGFESGPGGFRVHDPETRRRALHDRVGGAACPWLPLETVVSEDVTSLKRRISRARMFVVHSEELDKAGEKGVGPPVFDVIMQKLRAAWRILRDAGVKRFVFTADHGFLMLDDRQAATQPHGRKTDPQRRHVFSSVAADHDGEARVAMSDLRYAGVEGHVMFPETTAVFDRGKKSSAFVHGGNSLQERVIPVLTVQHRAAAGSSAVQYALRAAPKQGIPGMHCLDASVELAAQAQGVLGFAGSETVEVGLRVADAEGVQVEICAARGAAEHQGGVVTAKVGASFEVFFRLFGASDARVRVELYHPSRVAEVAPCVVEERFEVTATATKATDAAAPAPAAGLEAKDWRAQLPDEGVREVFAHLEVHGAVTETEVASMLGGPRKARRFANRFEAYAAKAPFRARIDVVGGVKRYVRDGEGESG